MNILANFQGYAQGLSTQWFGAEWGPTVYTTGRSLVMIVMVLVPVLLTVLYYQLVERWVIGWMQVRKGPNRVGWKGILQPIADAIKLLMKEQVVPSGANKALFFLAPVVSVAAVPSKQTPAAGLPPGPEAVARPRPNPRRSPSPQRARF